MTNLGGNMINFSIDLYFELLNKLIWNKIDTKIERWRPLVLNFPPRSLTFQAALLQCCSTFSGSGLRTNVDGSFICVHDEYSDVCHSNNHLGFLGRQMSKTIKKYKEISNFL